MGCDGLLKELWKVKPTLHVFGHVHWGKGRETVYYDECQKAYESLLARPKTGLLGDLGSVDAWVDASTVLLSGLYWVFFKWSFVPGMPVSQHAGILVNAAQMHGNTGKMLKKVEVVSI